MILHAEGCISQPFSCRALAVIVYFSSEKEVIPSLVFSLYSSDNIHASAVLRGISFLPI
jgi:hypothetical protein